MLTSAAHRPLLHLTIGNADIFHHELQPLEVFPDLLRAADVRLGDDFDEGHAAPVVIDEGVPPAVHQLAGVLLDVDAGDADPPPRRQLHIAVLAQRLVKLGDLVGFGQIRIDVIFPIHLGDPVNFAVGDQPGHDAVPHDLAVELGQGTG